jgi:hypothetical protein
MPKLPAMTEAQLQAAVVKLCKLYGLEWHHQQYSIGSKAGWPDLFICGSHAIARELKRENGKPTGAQSAWGITLRRAGISWDVWRPSDLTSGRVQRELEAIR